MNVSFVQKLKFDVILFAFSILVSFVGGLVGPLKTYISYGSPKEHHWLNEYNKGFISVAYRLWSE